jgi:tetratricopeptide (TPR) repeat protein
MIEILLQAERALAVGLVDQAERLYRQAADADPRNSIAVVGLARVALERGDEPEAWRQARRALAIDPENVAAQRLADRLEEVWAYRGESLRDAAAAEVAEVTVAADAVELTVAADAADAAEGGDTASAPTPVDPVLAGSDPQSATPDPQPRDKRSAIDRLLRRNRP